MPYLYIDFSKSITRVSCYHFTTVQKGRVPCLFSAFSFITIIYFKPPVWCKIRHVAIGHEILSLAFFACPFVLLRLSGADAQETVYGCDSDFVNKFLE